MHGLGLAMGGGVLVDDDRRRHRHRRHLRSGMGFARLVGVPLSPRRSTATVRRTHARPALFALSMLSVGLSIFAYCFGVIATVTGPGLGARSRGSGEPAAAARSASATSGRGGSRPTQPLPYPVIPLTVIAVDMIIATVPAGGAAGRDGLPGRSGPAISRRTRCSPRACSGGSGTRSCTCCSSRRSSVYYHLIPRYAKRPARRRPHHRHRLADRRLRQRRDRGAPHVHGLPERRSSRP